MFEQLIRKVHLVLTKPGRFFKSVSKEQGFGGAFTYFAILLVVPVVLGGVVGYFLQPFVDGVLSRAFQIEPQEQFTGLSLVGASALSYVFSLIFSFVGAAFLHVWILLFGGTANYQKTYQLYVYSETPTLLFSWVPVVGMLVWIYDVVLLIVGTEQLHKVKYKTAVLMYAIPAGFFLLVLLAFWGFVVYAAFNPGVAMMFESFVP